MITPELQWVVEVIEYLDVTVRDLHVFDDEDAANVFFHGELHKYNTDWKPYMSYHKEIKKPYKARVSVMRGNV